MDWSKVAERLKGFFGYGRAPGSEAIIPVVSAEPVYRKAAEKPKLRQMFNIRGGEGRSDGVLTEIINKTGRRARRYFQGKEVTHRVTDRQPGEIEFAFFRNSNKPLHIRWIAKEANETE